MSNQRHGFLAGSRYVYKCTQPDADAMPVDSQAQIGLSDSPLVLVYMYR